MRFVGQRFHPRLLTNTKVVVEGVRAQTGDAIETSQQRVKGCVNSFTPSEAGSNLTATSRSSMFPTAAGHLV